MPYISLLTTCDVAIRKGQETEQRLEVFEQAREREREVRGREERDKKEKRGLCFFPDCIVSITRLNWSHTDMDSVAGRVCKNCRSNSKQGMNRDR